MPNVFSIADDILIADFNEHDRDHNETLEKVPQICSQANINLNKDKCLLRCIGILFFSSIISWHGLSPDPSKIQALIDIPPKTEL